jgi:hypothetical protein
MSTRVIIKRGRLLRLVRSAVPLLSIFNLDKSSLATRTPWIFQRGDYGVEVVPRPGIYRELKIKFTKYEKKLF